MICQLTIVCVVGKWKCLICGTCDYSCLFVVVVFGHVQFLNLLRFQISCRFSNKCYVSTFSNLQHRKASKAQSFKVTKFSNFQTTPNKQTKVRHCWGAQFPNEMNFEALIFAQTYCLKTDLGFYCNKYGFKRFRRKYGSRNHEICKNPNISGNAMNQQTII